MPPSKRVRRTANAADEPAGPPASAADAPTPAASSAASPPAPSTGEDTGSNEGKKESVAHWSPIIHPSRDSVSAQLNELGSKPDTQ